MKTIFRTTLALAAAACLSSTAQADILTFEDLPSGGPAYFVSDYHGFRFGTNNPQTTAWFYTDENNPFYTPQSPTHFLATDFTLYTGAAFEAAQSITSATDFVFNGAYFSGEGQIRYQLYNNGNLVWTSADSQALLNSPPIFVASGYSGLVDEVVILGKQGYYALDNFTYSEGTQVPEPSALSLVVLAGLAGLVRRRRKA